MALDLLHVVPSYIPAYRYGGPIHSVHGLCAALVARGHRVTVATTSIDGPGNSDVRLDAPVDIDGVRVHYFPPGSARRIFHAPRMRAFIRDNVAGFDLVHTHSVFLWPTIVAARLSRRAGTPYVTSPRGMLVGDLIKRRSTLVKRLAITLFEKTNVERAAAVHVTSAVEEAEIRALGLRPARTIEIPNGVDLANTTVIVGPLAWPDLPTRYILCMGRLSWKKGLDRLVDAMAGMPDEVALVIAGNDDEGCWAGLQRRAVDAGNASRVRYVGYVEGARKWELLARADLFVLPSYSENFGNVVLEAMSVGVPVIVADQVGLAETVRTSGSGLVIDGSPRRIAEAVCSLWDDGRQRREMGGKARDIAASFSWSRIAERFEREYASIIETRSRR